MPIYLKNQRGVVHLFLLLAAVAVIAVIVIFNTSSFKDQLFADLFPKPPSNASGGVSYWPSERFALAAKAAVAPFDGAYYYDWDNVGSFACNNNTCTNIINPLSQTNPAPNHRFAWMVGRPMIRWNSSQNVGVIDDSNGVINGDQRVDGCNANCAKGTFLNDRRKIVALLTDPNKGGNNKGGTWIVGNEANNYHSDQVYFDPRDLADQFIWYSVFIKTGQDVVTGQQFTGLDGQPFRGDPNAKMVNSGVLYYEAVNSGQSGPGKPYNPEVYLGKFLAELRANSPADPGKYYPDIFNFHTYPFTRSEVLKVVNNNSDASMFKDVNNFYNFVNQSLLSVGLPMRPIWLTEFSANNSQTSTDEQKKFMDNLITKFVNEGKVQKWFWYKGRCGTWSTCADQLGTDPWSIILTDDHGSYVTESGQEYAALAQRYGTPPPPSSPPTPSPSPSVAPTRQPIGFLDGINTTGVWGWACDPDNFGTALQVHFYDGSKFIGYTTANQTREVGVGNACGGNRNHGYVYNFPASLKDGQVHNIYAYAINIPTGTNPLLLGSPKSITLPAPPTPLVASCSANPGSVYPGYPAVTWTANATGGYNQYHYIFSDNVHGEFKRVLNSTAHSMTAPPESYANYGDVTTTLTAISGAQTKTATCNARVNPRIAVSANLSNNKVVAYWSNNPGAMSKDWVGLYTPDLADNAYLTWVYTSSCTKSANDKKLTSGSCNLAIPNNKPGIYQIRYFANDGFTKLGTSNNVSLNQNIASIYNLVFNGNNHITSINNYDKSSGNFAATGYYQQNPMVTFTLTGKTIGSNFNFHLLYTGASAGYTVDGSGVIQDNLMLLGTARDSGGAALNFNGSPTNLLIKNTSFEGGGDGKSPLNWGYASAGAGSAYLTSGRIHSGNESVVVINNAGSWGSQVQQPIGNVSAGQRYLITGWVRSYNGADAHLIFQRTDNWQELVNNVYKNVPDSWQFIRIDTWVPAGVNAPAQVVCRNTKIGGVLFCDDITVTRL